MINVLFTIAYGVLFLVALLIGIGLHKAWRVWQESKHWEARAKQIHNQSAQYLSQDLKRLTPEEFYRQYRGKL